MASAALTIPEAATRRGVNEAQWYTLFNLYPGAKQESALMVLDYCIARGLDPMKKPCHIVPMRAKVGNEWVWVDRVMPGIYEYRTTAHRTGLYTGRSEWDYGPEMEFAGVKAPAWCAVTIYRWNKLAQVQAPFPVKVWFAECVATKNDGGANDRWGRAPIQMLTKVCEAAGLREAFPEEFGGTHTAEEMEGRSINENEDPLVVEAVPAFVRKSQPAPTPAPAPPPPPQPVTVTSTGASSTGVVVEVQDLTEGAIKIKLDTGFKTGTKNAEMVAALRERLRDGRSVELVTEPSTDPAKYLPRLKEIRLVPLEEGA